MPGLAIDESGLVRAPAQVVNAQSTEPMLRGKVTVARMRVDLMASRRLAGLSHRTQRRNAYERHRPLHAPAIGLEFDGSGSSAKKLRPRLSFVTMRCTMATASLSSSCRQRPAPAEGWRYAE